MQKLVLFYNIGDDCSWSSDIVSPFLFSSKEEAQIELMLLVEDQKTLYAEFMFAGLRLTAEPFGRRTDRGSVEFTEVTIYTLDEWFDHNAAK